MSGFYLMHRGWQEADIFAREEYSRRDAWVWLIEACCFRLTDNENLAFASNVSGTVMSIKSMSKRLLWRRTKVAHFLQDISSSDTFSVKFLGNDVRSEEHTSELQSLMRISYAVFCLKKKKNKSNNINDYTKPQSTRDNNTKK